MHGWLLQFKETAGSIQFLHMVYIHACTELVKEIQAVHILIAY